MPAATRLLLPGTLSAKGEGMTVSRFSIALLALLTLCAPSMIYAQTVPFIPKSLAPRTDKPVYLIGEQVGLILTNANIGDAAITWNNAATIINDCFIYDASGGLVFDGSSITVPGGEPGSFGDPFPHWDPVTIYPGQSVSPAYPLSFDLPGTYYFATSKSTAHQLASFDVVVPEPSSILALLTGISGLGGLMWKRRR